MITTPKMLGLLAVAFVAGSFVASPELRAYAANTVFSTDIVDGQVKTADLAANAVTAAKVKDGEIKAAEIATDAVGAAEIQGVTKLLFGQCVLSSSENSISITAGAFLTKSCNISGVDSDDSAIALINAGNDCFEVQSADLFTNQVLVDLKNDCATTQQVIAGKIGVIVFDK